MSTIAADNRPWMPFYVADFLAETAGMTAAEAGAYVRIVAYYWRTGPLPAASHVLAEIGRVSRDAIGGILSMFRHGPDGLLHHDRLDAQIEHARDVSAKRRAAAMASREARAKHAARMREWRAAKRRAADAGHSASAREGDRDPHPAPDPTPAEAVAQLVGDDRVTVTSVSQPPEIAVTRDDHDRSESRGILGSPSEIAFAEGGAHGAESNCSHACASRSHTRAEEYFLSLERKDEVSKEDPTAKAVDADASSPPSTLDQDQTMPSEPAGSPPDALEAETGTSAAPSGPKPPDARDMLWRRGLGIVRSLIGKPDGPSRALLGRWLRTCRDDAAALLAVLDDAADLRPIDPASWITAACKARTERVLRSTPPAGWFRLASDRTTSSTDRRGVTHLTAGGYEVDTIAEMVCQEAHNCDEHYAGDWETLIAWLADDIDPHDTILPTIERMAARPGYRCPARLSYFDATIRANARAPREEIWG